MTAHPGRLSAPTLLAVGRAINAARDQLVDAWLRWIGGREGGATIAEGDLRRVLVIILRLLAHKTGPLRREAREEWFVASELYGRLAEARGLSAGEVVDELQHLRELLIVELGDLIVAMPARQQLPAVLRVNRVCDHGVASAVVGYTDALVAKMFSRDGVPVPTADSTQELLAQFYALEDDIAELDARAGR